MFDVPHEYADHVHPEADEVPDTLYHVAYRSKRDSIVEEGLSVDAERTHNTGGAYGDDPDDEWLYEMNDEGEPQPSEWRPHGVYLWPTLEQALDYAAPRDADIYVIDATMVSDIIRDPCVAFNWGHQPEHNAYVAEYVPDRAMERMNPAEYTARLADRERDTGFRMRPPLSDSPPMDAGEQLVIDEDGYSL